MRYATVTVDGERCAARVVEGELELLDVRDVGELVRAGFPQVAVRGRCGWADAHVEAVVPEPGKIVCLGLNYVSHLVELFGESGLPEHPTLFAKFADTLTGPFDDVAVPPPALARTIDWEVELVVVVGRDLHRASVEEASAAIAGFTIANDISMRDWQARTTEWLQGKAWDRTTPLGPIMVTPEELSGAEDLLIECTVNGEVRQSANTGDMLFGPARALAYISTFTTLRAGDLVFTGTPSGVGLASGEPDLLRPGDLLVSSISGIGELRTRIVEE